MVTFDKVIDNLYTSRIKKTTQLMSKMEIKSLRQLALAAKLDHSQIVRAMRKEVAFTEKYARKIEVAYDLPILSLDNYANNKTINIYIVYKF